MVHQSRIETTIDEKEDPDQLSASRHGGTVEKNGITICRLKGAIMVHQSRIEDK